MHHVCIDELHSIKGIENMEPFVFKDSASQLSIESSLKATQKEDIQYNLGIKKLIFLHFFKNQKIIFWVSCLSLILVLIAYDIFYYFQEIKPKLILSAVPCQSTRISSVLKKSEKQIFKDFSFYELKWIAILKIQGHSVLWWKNKSGQIEEVKALDFLGSEKIQIKKIQADAHFIEVQDGAHQFRLDFK